MKEIKQNGFVLEEVLEEGKSRLIFYREDGDKLETEVKKYQAIISEMFESYYIVYKMEHAPKNNKFDIHLRLLENQKIIEVDYEIINPFHKLKRIIRKIFGN